MTTPVLSSRVYQIHDWRGVYTPQKKEREHVRSLELTGEPYQHVLHVSEQLLQVIQVCMQESQVIASHVGLHVIPQVATQVSQVNPQVHPHVYPHVDPQVMHVRHVFTQVSLVSKH
jgi:hypothetical protein